MTNRKQVQEALIELGIPNKFTLRTVGFSDLCRSNATVLTITAWKPSSRDDYLKVREKARELGVVLTD